MFKRIKLTMALALVAAMSMGMLLSGCEGDTATSGTNQPLNEVTGPWASVTGTVLDTNGAPLEGVTVGIAGQTETTNATGQYYFDKVSVQYAAGADQMSSAANAFQPVIIKANAPAGYLGATVYVFLVGQFDGSNDDTSNDNGNQYSDATVTTDVEGNNKTVTFVDGMLMSAGTVVLPQLSTTVTGWVRNCTTGEPLSGLTVALDFATDDNYDGGQPELNSFDATYENQTYMGTTGSDGLFTIAGVPADSHLHYNIPGYTWSYLSKTQSGPYTSDEAGVIINDGTLCATKITSSDSVNPVIIKASPVVRLAECIDCTDNMEDSSPYRAMLKEGGESQFDIVFSEAMDTTGINADSVRVRNVTTGAYIEDFTATLSGKTLTITLATALDEGTKIDVILERNDFADLGGNMLNSNPNTDGTWPGVSYEYPYGTGNTNGCADAECLPFIKVCLVTYKAPNTALGEVTGEQVCDNGTYPGDMAGLNNYASSVFIDCCDAMTGFDQLNGQGADQDYAEMALDALGMALDPDNANNGDFDIDVDTDIASVVFTPDCTNDVDAYMISVSGSGSVSSACQSSDNICDAASGIFYVANTCADATVGITNTDVGAVVTITPVDDLGYTGTSTTITLDDCVEPTVTLQTAYGVCNTDAGTDSLFAYGSGAELSDESVAGTFASVVYPVTPRMLARQEATPWNGGVVTNNNMVPNPNPAAGLVEPIALWDIYNGNVSFVPPNTTLAARQIQDPVAFNRTDIYDATAFAAYAPARRLGLEVSEDLVSIDTTAFSYAGSTNITDLNFLNNVVNQDNALGSDAGDVQGTGLEVGTNNNTNGGVSEYPRDLILFNNDQIIDFANLDHGETIDMTDVLSDLVGLPSSINANAKAIVWDRMPAFPTSAYFGDSDSDGDNEFVINFNEVVTYTSGTTTFALEDPSNVAADCVTTLFAADLSTDGLTITVDQVDLCDAGGTWAPGVFFPTTGVTAVYDETAYDTVAGVGTDLPHGILNVDMIEDLRGNSWSDWTGTDPADCIVPDGQVDTPVFAAVNAAVVTPLQIGVVAEFATNSDTFIPAGTYATDTSFTVVFTSNVALDWHEMFNSTTTYWNSLTGAISSPGAWFGMGTVIGTNVIDSAALQAGVTVTGATATGNSLRVNLLIAGGTTLLASATTSVGILDTATLLVPDTPQDWAGSALFNNTATTNFAWSIEHTFAEFTAGGEAVRDPWPTINIQ